MVQQQHRCELGNVGSHVMECSSRAVPFFSRSFVKSRAFLFVDFNTAPKVDKNLLKYNDTFMVKKSFFFWNHKPFSHQANDCGKNGIWFLSYKITINWNSVL